MHVFIKQNSRENYFPAIYILLNRSYISIRKLFQVTVADLKADHMVGVPGYSSGTARPVVPPIGNQ
jgi:hypothetical protein